MSKRLIKYIINTCVDAEDIIASTLFDYGIEGVEIEDKVGLTNQELKQQFVDIPLNEIDDGLAKIIFYVEIVDNDDEKNHITKKENTYIDDSYRNVIYKQYTEIEIANLINNVIEEIEYYKNMINLGSLKVEKVDITDFDYMNKWKENFKKIYIDNICIKPTFEKLNENDKNKIIINIDPKAAFGTGNHQTTQLCIESICRFAKENNISSLLDVGCGSGILGIVAKKLGINNVLSIDVDDTIGHIIEENAELNGINKNDFKFISGNIIDDDKIKTLVGYEKYDIICANILAPIIILLITVGNIDRHLKKNGILIVSGILDKYEKDVCDAISKKSNLEIIDIVKKDEWLNFNIRKCSV